MTQIEDLARKIVARGEGLGIGTARGLLEIIDELRQRAGIVDPAARPCLARVAGGLASHGLEVIGDGRFVCLRMTTRNLHHLLGEFAKVDLTKPDAIQTLVLGPSDADAVETSMIVALVRDFPLEPGLKPSET